MFPTDSDFLILYGLYLALFFFLVAGTIFSRSKRKYLNNLVFYLVYTGIMVFVFSNKENFKYGSSLVVLFLRRAISDYSFVSLCSQQNFQIFYSMDKKMIIIE